MQNQSLLLFLLGFCCLSLSATSPCHTTICHLANGTATCCPVDEASCCPTGDFCCPKNFRCDVANQRCVKDNTLFAPFHLRTTKIETVSDNVVCPDNLSECPEETTCCQMDDGSYGCCPIPNAVCCDDHIHCWSVKTHRWYLS